MNLSELDPSNVGSWPMPIKLLSCLGLTVLVVVLAWFLMISGMSEEITGLENQEKELRSQFEFEQQRALNLEPLRQQLAQMEQVLQQMMRQLPSKTEMPDLIIDVSQAALTSGLNNELFQPGGEITREFYAEQPIALRLIGSYHQFGAFVSSVSLLPRVVILTMNDMGLKRVANGQLELAGTVKTYRYLDDAEMEEAARAGGGR